MFANEYSGACFCSIYNSRGRAIINIKTLRSPDPHLAAEAERLIKSMPRWKPAQRDGKPVRQRFVFPVMFRLN
ncbi:MAG: energy transducer TonB [Bacteroidaceae bacterium]|nr:energy transducer TonB [Bacteroidaceae bacterium]